LKTITTTAHFLYAHNLKFEYESHFRFGKMSKASKLLEELLGVQQFQDKPEGIQGILQTKDYSEFIILSDAGNELLRFTGAKLANKCLPGDHVAWDGEKCKLELRDEHPLIIGTLELTNKSKYGLTSRGIPIYLFTPYNKSYPHFIVGCSEKDVSKNRIGLIKLDDWLNSSTFPRGNLQQILGVSGDFEAEKQALIWQACPWKYPKGAYPPQSKENILRQALKGFTFNIDPKGCKDVDDVLTFEQLDNDKWKVTITISDVATFVEDGGVVDIFASLIGQTLYDSDGNVIRPMLPKEYSEEICSLIPGKSSYGISLQFVWDGKEISDKEWFESSLKTDKTYTYEEFQESESPFKTPLAEISSYLAKEEVTDSHKWIECMMVFYNTEAGRMLKESGMGILRRHSAPNLEKLESYKAHLPELEKLAYSSAEYCLAEEPETKHFGLESNNYAHASSPIRRYADLVNQRVLKLLIRNSKERFIVPQAMYDMNYKVKLNKNFGRDMEFLKAISSGQTSFRGIIIDKMVTEADMMKIKIYIPLWKRTISTKYKKVNENTVLSRDEKREVDVSYFREVDVKCAFNINSRNWKERVIINIT
jgi:exoribonuclease R